MPRKKRLDPAKEFAGLIAFLTTDLRKISDPSPLFIQAFSDRRPTRIPYAVGIPPGDIKDQFRRVQEKGNALLDVYLGAKGPVMLSLTKRTERAKKDLPVPSLTKPLLARVEELITLCRDPEQLTLLLRRCSVCRRPFASARTTQQTCKTACRKHLYYESHRIRLHD